MAWRSEGAGAGSVGPVLATLRILLGNSFIRFAFIAAIIVFIPMHSIPGFSQILLADECGPSVLLAGPENLTRPIGDILTSLNVSTSPAPECPKVRAEVEAAEGGILVRITDSSGRISERLVDDAEAAATIIESWTRGELNLDLINPDMDVIVGEDVPPAPPEPKRFSIDDRRGYFSVFGEIFGAGDGSAWYGTGINGCYRFGPICPGVQARFMADGGTGPPHDGNDFNRIGADAMVTAGIPLRLKRLAVMPRIGVGSGWTRTRGKGDPSVVTRIRVPTDIASVNDEMVGTLAQDDEESEPVTEEIFDTFSPIVETSIDVGFIIDKGWGLGLGLVYKYHFSAHGAEFEQSGAKFPGEPWSYTGFRMMVNFGR